MHEPRQKVARAIGTDAGHGDSMARRHCVSAPEQSQSADPFSPEAQEEKLFAELLDKYRAALISSQALETLPIEPRAPQIGKWMREGDLGFIYGRRASGKTWLVAILATHLAEGKEIDEDWPVPAAGDVVLIDGEMPVDDFRDRLKGLSPQNLKLHCLHHEVLFERTGLEMDLTKPLVQRCVTELCLAARAKLLILDNLSCLFRGLAENDNDAWDLVLSWLLELRHRRITVLIVHHAGYDGAHMRGGSRREDAAFWTIKVEELDQAFTSNERAAHFKTSFDKRPRSGYQEPVRHWHVATEADGTISYSSNPVSVDEQILSCVQDGIKSSKDIAETTELHRATVNRALARLEKASLIEQKGNGPRIWYEPRGFMKNQSPNTLANGH